MSASPRKQTFEAGWRPCAKSARAVDAWQRATTSSQPITSHSSNVRQYGSGGVLMSPRPKIQDGSTAPADHRQPGRTPLGKAIFEATHLEAACTQRCDRFV